MTIHRRMFDCVLSSPKKYPTPLVWLGTWSIAGGMCVNGFHVWDRFGNWVGVYQTSRRAVMEASKFV